MELRAKETECVSSLNKTDRKTEKREEESQIYFIAQRVGTA